MRKTARTLESWGRYPKQQHEVRELLWRDQARDIESVPSSVLPFGMGRSYGDSCLNDGGTLLTTPALDHLLAFDEDNGLLRCEAGVTLAQILQFGVPRGWFLPTTPGTKFVTVGGAIANDVHGKNHHVAGTFGRHVRRFELVRSDGKTYLCSPEENPELYAATIGGLGLTGLITWAEVQLRAVSGPYISMDSVRFGSLDEFFEVSAESDRDFEYTMSWVDCLASGKQMGRGLFMRGNHSWQPHIPGKKAGFHQKIALPVDLPSFVLNRLSIKAFNTLHYHAQLPKRVHKTLPYDPFFYPLDSIGTWNKMYGQRGFLQHQCVIPHEAGAKGMRAILQAISDSGEGSFLAVLKTFGSLTSPGMMSFPRPGVTLALDFPLKGAKTLALVDRLDDIVLEYGGAVYPAKDARMSSRMFDASFPRWREFARYVDPGFSSSFWRRVTGDLKETS